MSSNQSNLWIQYLYDETSVYEDIAVEEELASNEESRSAFQEIYEGYKALPQVEDLPSDFTLENILQYGSHHVLH